MDSVLTIITVVFYDLIYKTSLILEINMSHKFNPEKAQRLIARGRYEELKPEILLQRLGVAPGSTILDLGCGNGFFSFPAAVGMGEKGMVIAADTSEEMLLLLNRRVPPENIQVLQVEEVAMDVDSDSVDAVVALALYHEFKNPAENLEEIARVLVPGGKLMILDWDAEAEGGRGPSLDHRVKLSKAVGDLTQAGFKIDHTENYIPDMWLILAHLPG
jgi:ubiquinone/menaquinone biosynthesis C-methylase UbiE